MQATQVHPTAAYHTSERESFVLSASTSGTQCPLFMVYPSDDRRGTPGSAKSVSRSTVRVTFSVIIWSGPSPAGGRRGGGALVVAHEKPSPTRTMMSMKEMPVAAGMQWKAKSSRMELAEYAQRKKSVQDLGEGGAAAGWG